MHIIDTCEALLLFSIDHQSRVPDFYNSNTELKLLKKKAHTTYKILENICFPEIGVSIGIFKIFEL